ncbi:terminase large subunit [Ensifer sp. ENS08]|uniref:terminase large subunit n=1 Tax=Ensifer sp. ENS08 TaxID=2769273 RepID=UPI00177D7C28|nr:terminase large subunit [Ensifer sp. ENS08]MBD9571744.1 terminase large subunit [Ensifer sp. ENS08]
MSLAVSPEALASSWNFACPDWFERLQQGRSIIPDLPLDEAKAERGLRIFEKLRVPDIDDKPSLGEACGPWFKDIVRTVFGSVDDDGVRHVSEIFALVGKKNSKTTYSGGLIVTCLLANKIPRAEILFVGPTQEIADAAFQQAVGMIEDDEEGYLQKRFHIQDHKKVIRDRVTKAFIKIKTFDMKVMTGSKPVIVLLDELHIMGSISYATRVIRQIRGALVRRRDSLFIIISTQSDEEPAGAFKAELEYARGVRDGRITGNIRMLPILYEFPEAMQIDEGKPWMDPRNWHLVMPNLGRSLHLDSMVADFEAEREKGDESIQIWASQHLNVQVGLALHGGRWIGSDYWPGAADRRITIEYLLEVCDCIVGGIDGGGLDDLLGLTLLGRHKLTRQWLWWSRAWAQPDVLRLRKEIAARLTDFSDDGDLVICKTPTQDIEDVAAILERVWNIGLMPERGAIGLDPQGVAAMVDEITSKGIPDEALVAVSQGYRLSSSIWGAERKLKDGTLKHCGSKMLSWCVSNTKAQQAGNAVIITKQVSGKAKIDPVISGFNAISLMSRNPEAAGAGPDIGDFLKEMAAQG